jgi:hypothetical protein
MSTTIQALDPNGRPLEGIEVALVNNGLNLILGNTDRKGILSYDDVTPEGAAWEVTGRIDGEQTFRSLPLIRAKEGELVRVPLKVQRESAGMGAASRVIVLDSVTNRPLIGAQVALVHSDGTPFKNATTDERGQAFSDGAKSGMVWEGRTEYHFTGRVKSTGNDILVLKRVDGSNLPEEMLGAELTQEETVSAGEKFPSTPQPSPAPAPSGGGIPLIPIIALGAAVVGVAMYAAGGSSDEEEEED